ncbi:hypothetical protein VP01_3891g1 [Puccinia sorghi]|uniref:Uncharacterized protein n=1 Tax=Puccinia sorghi TaxID=27349 RepID=A0A0L6USR7_9BASI|nr:hypothetical protein VP01_3891g1 [Puccinia sorghi]
MKLIMLSRWRASGPHFVWQNHSWRMPSSKTSSYLWITKGSLCGGGIRRLPFLENMKVILVWCPQNQDIEGNEEVYQLQKCAVNDEDSPCLQIGGNFRKVLSFVTKGLKPNRPAALSLPQVHISLLNQLYSGHSSVAVNRRGNIIPDISQVVTILIRTLLISIIFLY